MIRVICAWCQRTLLGLLCYPLVSHGLCRRCVPAATEANDWSLWYDCGGEG